MTTKVHKLIRVRGQVYRLVAAQRGEYDALKGAVLGDTDGELAKIIGALKALASKLMLFGEQLTEDDARFITVMSSKLNEDTKASSMAYDLGDIIAKVERMSDKMFRVMPPELRNRKAQ